MDLARAASVAVSKVIRIPVSLQSTGKVTTHSIWFDAQIYMHERALLPEPHARLSHGLSDNLGGWRGSVIVLGMVFGSFGAVKDGLLSVAVRDQRLVRRVCVVFFFVVLRGLMVMPPRLLVMFCRERVMFCACPDPGHHSFLILDEKWRGPCETHQSPTAIPIIEQKNIRFSYLATPRVVFKFFVVFQI